MMLLTDRLCLWRSTLPSWTSSGHLIKPLATVRTIQTSRRLIRQGSVICSECCQSGPRVLKFDAVSSDRLRSSYLGSYGFGTKILRSLLRWFRELQSGLPLRFWQVWRSTRAHSLSIRLLSVLKGMEALASGPVEHCHSPQSGLHLSWSRCAVHGDHV